jgi:methyl-accepting chemotaxis protein
VISKVTGDVIVVCTAAIKGDDGSIVGVLFGTMSLKSLYENQLSDVDLGTGYVYMIDKNGLIIAHPDASKLLVESVTTNSDNARLSAAMTAAMAGKTGSSSYVYSGIEKMVAYAPTGVNGWSLLVTQPADEALGGVQDFTRVSVILLVVVAVVAGVASFVAATSISGGITLMTEVAAELAEGGLAQGEQEAKVAATLKRSDELGRLAMAFRSMIDATAQMAQAAERVAEYDLTAEVQPRSDRDVLGKALYTMILNLRTAISSVRQGADGVSQSSATLAGSADSAGQATGQVAITIE